MIPKNAITMRGTIDRCWLIALRADPDKVAAALPRPLEPILHGGYAFLNIVVSHLKEMRPAPLPAAVGLSYWHAAYRIYARFAPEGREPIEGLYFLRSDADSSLMVQAGNLLTDFAFHRSEIVAQPFEGDVKLEVNSATEGLAATLSAEPPVLAVGSPFESIEEAARFLEYEPAGISVSGGRVNVMRIGRDEANWRNRLVSIVQLSAPYLARFDAVPEIAYEVEPISYQWNRAERYPI